MTHVAIGASYATLAELKSWMGIPDSNTSQDTALTLRLAGASADINRWCHRQFGRDEVASARTYRPGETGVDVDDFWDDADLAAVPYMGTTAGTAWDLTQFDLEPLNGVVDGVPGWPYRRLCYPYTFLGGLPYWYTASKVIVTATWGWADVPEPVHEACLMLAAMTRKAADTPFGVSAFGDYAVRIRSNPMAQEKLTPYVLDGTGANSYLVGS
jgi:hypothetical protein